MASSKKLAGIVSSIASLVYFFLIILQVPLFRVPSRTGQCSTPIELTSFQLIASEIFPVVVVKALLFPGAIAHAIIKETAAPSYDDFLDAYNFTNVKIAPATTDLQHLEVLAGSYFSVAGAILGVLKPGRMSLFGTLLIIWGLVKEVAFRKSTYIDSETSVYIYPTMFIALISAFLSIKTDVRKIVRTFKVRQVDKPPRKFLKAKHK